MRILTRYILREVTTHALIGVGVFTFVLFTRDLGQILELVVRNSAPLPSVAQVFFLIIPVTLTISIPAGVLVGNLDRAEPIGCRQRNHRDARQRHWSVELFADRLDFCGRGVASGLG